MAQYEYLFGPVPSRRFGRSLGVDLTPFKTCPLDCIFCQLGRTTVKTMERAEYVPVDAVTAELAQWFHDGGRADYVTLSGAGEPTLHTGFGQVLEFIKSRSSIPAALLTNGTMLRFGEVREAAAVADVVKISLSCRDQTSFEIINRPHPDLTFEALVDGMRQFRKIFRGSLWLEVFLVWGMNSTPADVQKIAMLAADLKPDRIQLNTAVRPPAEEFAVALPQKQMNELAGLFEPFAEVIAEFSSDLNLHSSVDENAVLDMLRRRPCTAEQTAEVFGVHINEIVKYIGKLMRTGRIRAEHRNGLTYYAAEQGEHAHHSGA